LKKLFSKVYDDIFRNFTDDAIRGFDNLFIKAFNQKNMMEQGGKLFLKSMNPKSSPLPMDTIEEILLNVGKGRLKPEQVLQYLRRKEINTRKVSPKRTNIREQNSQTIIW